MSGRCVHVAAIVLLLIAGCSNAGAPVSVATHEPVATAEMPPAVDRRLAAQAEEAATVEPAVSSELNQQAGSGQEDALTVTAAEFVPPYLDRTDPFQRPNIARVAAAAETSRDQQVELRGFVNVAGLKALLAIDGEVATFGPGDEYRGLEVIEIAPPKIILQRGRARWTESLFD